MPYSKRSYLVGGNIYPSRFVKIEAGESNTILQSGAGDHSIGVSHEGTREAPIPGASAFAGIEGDLVEIYGLGQPCEVLAAATIAAGDYLRPDADGKAVMAVPGERYSAIADSDCASGEKCKCTVRDGVVSVAGFLVAAQQSLAGAGAVNVTSAFTALTTTGANALTLADGTYPGQIKEILMTVDAGDGTLTPTNLANGTTITFSNVGDYVKLQWSGTEWVVIARYNQASGAITSPVLA
ncbi:MAG: hypothetical protein ACO1RT_16220 [Planctomycetaceae bacterium]